MITVPIPFPTALEILEQELQELRTNLAQHPPGSEARWGLIQEARNVQDDWRIQKIMEQFRCPRSFRPVCPTCKTVVRKDLKQRAWTCGCGASGRLDDAAVLYQHQIAQNEKKIDRYTKKERVAEERWLDQVASYVPAKPFRCTLPAAENTAFYRATASLLGTITITADGFMDNAIWEGGGDLLLNAMLEPLLIDLTKGHTNTLLDRVWLNVFRGFYEPGCGHTWKRKLCSTTVARSWHLLDVIARCERRWNPRVSTYAWKTAWFTPNMLAAIDKSDDPVASFKGVSTPMRALIRRYVDFHYDLALSNLHATARKYARRPVNATRRARILHRLEALKQMAIHSIDHLERWTVLRDDLVAMGYTTVADANAWMVCHLLDSSMLNEDDAMRWTLRLMDEGLPEVAITDALRPAAENGLTDVVDLLINNGADVISRVAVESVLGAILWERFDTAYRLLDRGVPANAVRAIVDDKNQLNDCVYAITAEQVHAAVRAWEGQALRKVADEVIADLPEVQAAQRRRL
jgi:hypothetical protein